MKNLFKSATKKQNSARFVYEKMSTLGQTSISREDGSESENLILLMELKQDIEELFEYMKKAEADIQNGVTNPIMISMVKNSLDIKYLKGIKDLLERKKSLYEKGKKKPFAKKIPEFFKKKFLNLLPLNTVKNEQAVTALVTKNSAELESLTRGVLEKKTSLKYEYNGKNYSWSELPIDVQNHYVRDFIKKNPSSILDDYKSQ